MRINGSILANHETNQNLMEQLEIKEASLVLELSRVQRDIFILRSQTISFTALMQVLDITDNNVSLEKSDG